MHILFLHFAREWSGTARAFSVAARGLAARGHTVRFLVEPESGVEQSASRIATVASRLGSVDPQAQHDVAPFEVMQFNSEGGWLGPARRLRNLFRQWDADVVFVTTDREHIIASVACWLGRRGSIVRRTPAGCLLEMHASGKIASWLTKTSFLFAAESDAAAAKIPRKGGRPIVAMLGVDTTRYPERTGAEIPEGAD